MFQIGDKVIIDTGDKSPLEGYIVAITIDPIEESAVAFEKQHWIGYTVRVYRKFYTDGYADFYRNAWDLRKVNEDVV